jgi:formate C-acetyltransferase
MDGCMESGLDVTCGGAKYNAMGSSGIGCANVADSLYAIKHLCFDTKTCTTRQLYDALMANWEGYENLHQYVLNKMPRYGNDIEDVDDLAGWAMNVFAKAFNKCSCDRVDHCQAGIYPVSTHIMFGRQTWATPDGRKTGEPLSDGISPKQGMDTNGPAAVLKSVAKIPHRALSNGTLLNMKFHPATVSGDEGNMKLRQLVETFFDMDGMHIQYNVIGADKLREAQRDPEANKNLVIRIAGFSAYFVELDKVLQDDLISRTDQQV